MSPTLYALVTALVLQDSGQLQRASVIEGLTQAACTAEMRQRLDAHRATVDGVRIYVMCIPMPGPLQSQPRLERPEVRT